MIKIQGIWWPDNVGESYEHALKHVRSIEYAIGRGGKCRTAVQAGGNIGLWPLRLGRDFARVFTFEPEPISRECLEANVRAQWPDPEACPVVVSAAALGDTMGTVGINRKSLGSHKIDPAGAGVQQITIDSLKIEDLDLLQLDCEGYEWHALVGGADTIARCHPIVQVELRNFTRKFGKTDTDVWDLLGSLGYRLAAQQPGSDFVFEFIK